MDTKPLILFLNVVPHLDGWCLVPSAVGWSWEPNTAFTATSGMVSTKYSGVYKVVERAAEDEKAADDVEESDRPAA